MRNKGILIVAALLFIWGCTGGNRKNRVAALLEIPEPKDWILVIHPEGCKTCLDSFYSELLDLPPTTGGSIVILGKSSKTLRLNPLIENSPIPRYLHETKRHIQERIVDLQDQILVFKENEVLRFDILDYEKVFLEWVPK